MTTLVARRLGKRLATMRAKAGKTPADVEAARITSRRTLGRVEAAKTLTGWPVVVALGELYGGTKAEIAVLKRLSMQAEKKGLTEKEIQSTPSGFSLLPELEADASTIDCYEAEILPGLAQTPEYMKTVLTSSPLVDPDAVETIVKQRASRVAAVSCPVRVLVPSHVWSAAASYGGAGGCVEVRTFDKLGPMIGSFQIMTFDDPLDDDIVYTETVAGSTYLEDRDIVARYATVFEHVWRESKPV